MEEKTIDAECESCMATGLIPLEGGHSNLATVCSKCGGVGQVILSYIPFTGRAKLSGVEFVYSRGCAFVEIPHPSKITYKEFLEGKFPQEKA